MSGETPQPIPRAQLREACLESSFASRGPAVDVYYGQCSKARERRLKGVEVGRGAGTLPPMCFES